VAAMTIIIIFQPTSNPAATARKGPLIMND
jgi:hypothetical protein